VTAKRRGHTAWLGQWLRYAITTYYNVSRCSKRKTFVRKYVGARARTVHAGQGGQHGGS